MEDTIEKSIDMIIDLIKGKTVDETQIPKLNSRQDLLDIYIAFKKTVFLIGNIKI